MEITAVIRGEEWLPSLPMHKLIYDAFGWEPPKFMHLPLILKPTGKESCLREMGIKMGFPVFPLQWGSDTAGFREMGFLPEGLINYLAFLGWNDGGLKKRFFSLEELENIFCEWEYKRGARFDYEKAKMRKSPTLSRTSPDTLIENSKV